MGYTRAVLGKNEQGIPTPINPTVQTSRDVIFHRARLFFAFIIAFLHEYIKFTTYHHYIIQIYIIIHQHMQLCKENIIIIIDTTQHKGTIEEKYAHT